MPKKRHSRSAKHVAGLRSGTKLKRDALLKYFSEFLWRDQIPMASFYDAESDVKCAYLTRFTARLRKKKSYKTFPMVLNKKSRVTENFYVELNSLQSTNLLMKLDESAKFFSFRIISSVRLDFPTP